MAFLATSTREELVWRVLCLLNLYRLLVPTVLLAVYMLVDNTSVGWAYERLFLFVQGAYFLLAILAIVALKMRWPRLDIQTWLHFALDALAISLLMYASGGAASGLGMLLVLPVGAVSLISHLRSGFLLVAACSTLVVLTQEVMIHLAGYAQPSDYTGAGVLGAILFIVALSTRPLAERLRESEEQVRQKEVDLANLAELSHYIVQNLRESLLVVDPSDRIRLINESAAKILGARNAVQGALLGEVSPRLLYFLEMWRQGPQSPSGAATTFVSADGTTVIQPHFAVLGKESPGPVLVFLEDTSLLSERVQQSKLAALGRLSASIAHEIRNPVGALSHAGQLLGESPHLTPQERRLTEIIRANSDRVSTIINNVLQLSRRDVTSPERLTLEHWIDEFAAEFRETTQIPPHRLHLTPPDDEDAREMEVRVDPTHLHQVVWNLCDNALKHSRRDEDSIDITWGRVGGSGRPYLEISDRGPGIAEDVRDKIFEPFFTASDGGTGLGLFIARELCQCNGALLLYEPRTGGGSVFRIVFADPQRWEG